MRFEATIIIEDDNGSLKSEFGLIVDICKNKIQEEAPAALGLKDTTCNFISFSNVFK